MRKDRVCALKGGTRARSRHVRAFCASLRGGVGVCCCQIAVCATPFLDILWAPETEQNESAQGMANCAGTTQREVLSTFVPRASLQEDIVKRLQQNLKAVEACCNDRTQKIQQHRTLWMEAEDGVGREARQQLHALLLKNHQLLGVLLDILYRYDDLIALSSQLSDACRSYAPHVEHLQGLSTLEGQQTDKVAPERVAEPGSSSRQPCRLASSDSSGEQPSVALANPVLPHHQLPPPPSGPFAVPPPGRAGQQPMFSPWPPPSQSSLPPAVMQFLENAETNQARMPPAYEDARQSGQWPRPILGTTIQSNHGETGNEAPQHSNDNFASLNTAGMCPPTQPRGLAQPSSLSSLFPSSSGAFPQP